MFRIKGLNKLIYGQLNQQAKNQSTTTIQKANIVNYNSFWSRTFSSGNQGADKPSEGQEQQRYHSRHMNKDRQYGQQSFSQRRTDFSLKASNQSQTTSHGSQSRLDVGEIIKQRFGKSKTELLDSWLEMDSQQLVVECQKQGITPSEKHIENMQKLFENLKKVEQDLLEDQGVQFNPQGSRNTGSNQQHERYERRDSNYQQSQQKHTENSISGEQLFKQRRMEKKDFNKETTLGMNEKGQQEIEKAKQVLNEHLDRIMSKRRKRTENAREESTQIHSNEMKQQSHNQSISVQEDGSALAKADKVKVDLSMIKEKCKQRGPLDHSNPNRIFAQQVTPETVDKIFEYDQKELNNYFDYFGTSSQNSLTNQMNLKFADFEQLPTISKKKILINLTNYDMNFDINPNSKVQIMKQTQPLPKYIDYLHKNWVLLSKESKAIISSQLESMIPDFAQDSRLISNPQFLNQFIQLIQDTGIAKNHTDFFKKTTKHLVEANETIYHDLITNDQSLQYGKLIENLSQFKIAKTDLYKIQNAYYNGIRKLYNKQNIKQLNFAEQMTILKAIPKVEGDAFSSQKSLHYIILHEILTQNQQKWQQLEKDDVMTIIDKVMEMHKCRDLNIKLRGCLGYIKTYQYSLDDIYQMVIKLAEGKHGNIDAKFLSQIVKRNIKTMANITNANQASKHFDFYEYLYKNSPLTFTYLTQEFKLLLHKSLQISQQQHMSLNEMIKFSKIMIPSLFNPNLFFASMITTQRFNFSKDADKAELYDFISTIYKRAQDGLYDFEHLQLSSSRVHRNFKPFNEKTVFLIQRILNDLTAPEQINQADVKIINNLLSFKPLAMYLFKNQDEVESLANKMQDTMSHMIDSKLQNITVYDDETKKSKEFVIDFKDWIEQFTALSNLKGFASGNKKILKTINKLEPKLFDLLKQELYRCQNINLNDLFELNSAVLRLFNEGSLEQYNQSVLPEIIQATLEYYFLGVKPFILSFEKFKKNIKISKIIHNEATKALMQEHLPGIIQYLVLKKDHQNNKELAQKIILGGSKKKEDHETSDESQQKIDIQNVCRSLVNEDLTNLFKVIDQYQLLTDESVKILVNVAPNLMTIEPEKIQYYHPESTIEDQRFVDINEKIEYRDQQTKQMILKKYLELHTHYPQALRTQEANLGPLSYLMANVFEQYTDEDVLTCLTILGSEKVENYHETFIKKLFDRYSSQPLIENMSNNNQKFFFKFAKHWPHFLKNNAILNQLINMKQHSSALAKQQSETINILTKMNVLHPELMESHFETFMKMKDRDRVMEYMKEFIHCCATLGYTNFDVAKLTQVFRRIYKTPDQVPINLLLDYCVVLALSNEYYKDFDAKSVEFVEQAINLIEQSFTGLESLVVPVKSEDDETQKVKISYFKSIPSINKIYNKVLLKPSNNYLKKEKMKKAWDKLLTEAEQPLQATLEEFEEEEKENKAQQKNLENADSRANDSIPPLDKLDSELSEDMLNDQVQDVFDKMLDTSADQAFQDQSMEKTFDPEDYSNETKRDSDIQTLISEDGTTGQFPVPITGYKEKKIYERKARESLYSEELEFHQFRKKKLQDLDKKSKHLLLFSNINQLNFVDVNQSQLSKAWSVLFHFRNKTFNSIIYDEFESIVMRNTIGKSKGHELFSQFYLKLVESTYEKGIRLHLNSKCDQTGWPIDICMSHSNKQGKKLALFFLLQEEVCLNAKEQQEEPLGLQKLMLKHLTNISDYKVEFVTENDFYMNKDSLQGYVQYLLLEKLHFSSASFDDQDEPRIRSRMTS